MILNARQRKVIDEALALGNELEATVTYLERLAEVYPQIRERVDNLRTRRDFIRQVAEVALQADQMLDT